LGYGGGSAAQIIHDEINPEAQIVGVELDSEVVALTEI
jgi:spermidine synthase